MNNSLRAVVVENPTPYEHLKECLRLEVISKSGKKDFSWLKVLHRVLFSRKKRFYFWWRIANYLYSLSTKRSRKMAGRINDNLRRKYGADISPAAFIGAGMKVNHFIGIVVRSECIIGRNLNLRQNTTIGRKDSTSEFGFISIGDNVDIGANSCIIGNIKIGDDVIIGAMSFINKDVPSRVIVYNKREKELILRENLSPSLGLL